MEGFYKDNLIIICGFWFLFTMFSYCSLKQKEWLNKHKDWGNDINNPAKYYEYKDKTQIKGMFDVCAGAMLILALIAMFFALPR